jgi:hypothetical protein
VGNPTVDTPDPAKRAMGELIEAYQYIDELLRENHRLRSELHALRPVAATALQPV